MFLLCSPFLTAQPIKDADVPFAVMDKFTLLYPDAKSLLWEMKEEKYVALFRNNKMETSAMLMADGTVVKTETEIKIIALPEAATAYLTLNFESRKIEETSIAEDQAGIITFKAMVDKVDYTFDSNGHLIATDQVVIGAR
jgi:hypothetical protein